MANTMFSNRNNKTNYENIINGVKQFSENLKKSGKDPKALLEEELASGKYSESQISEAVKKAKFFAKFFK